MAAGHVTDRIGHGQTLSPNARRHPEQSNTHLREAGRDDGAAASAERQPERADRLGSIFLRVHVKLLLEFGERHHFFRYEIVVVPMVPLNANGAWSK